MITLNVKVEMILLIYKTVVLPYPSGNIAAEVESCIGGRCRAPPVRGDVKIVVVLGGVHHRSGWDGIGGSRAGT